MHTLLYVCFFGIAATLTVCRPARAVGFLVGSYFFETWAMSTVGPAARYRWLTNAGAAGLVLLGLWVMLVTDRGRFRLPAPSLRQLAPIALLAFAALSVLWSQSFEHSVDEWLAAAPYALVFVLVAPILITDGGDLSCAMRALLGTLCLSLPLVLVFGEWSAADDGSGGRAMVILGTTGREREDRISPLTLAGGAGTAIVLCAVYVFWDRRLLWRLAYVGVAALSAVLIFMSGTRGQAIAAVLASGAMLLWFGWLHARWLVLGGGTIAVLFVAKLGFDTVRVNSHWEYKQWRHAQYANAVNDRWSLNAMSEDSQERVAIQSYWLEHWQEAGLAVWLGGVGSMVTSDEFETRTYCHNVPIETLVEEGLIGVLLLAVVVCYAAKNARSLHAEYWSKSDWAAITILCALTIYECTIAMKQGTLLDQAGQSPLILYLMLLGRLATLRMPLPRRVLAGR